MKMKPQLELQGLLPAMGLFLRSLQKVGVFGLLKVNSGALQRINEVEEIVFATE